MASKLYKLVNKTSGNNWNAVQRNWEADLGISLKTEELGHVWKTPHKVSKSVKNKMINYNFVHRTYFTPVRLYKIQTNVSLASINRVQMLKSSILPFLFICLATLAAWL